MAVGLTDSKAVSRMVAEAADSLGILDALVNNAEISARGRADHLT